MKMKEKRKKKKEKRVALLHVHMNNGAAENKNPYIFLIYCIIGWAFSMIKASTIGNQK
jgi:hypothetical protein